MDTDNVRERVRELDGVVVAVGLTLLMFGSVMIGSGALGVAQSQTTQASAEKVSCNVKGLSPVGTASAQATVSDDAIVVAGTNGGKVVARYADNGTEAWNHTQPYEVSNAPTIFNGTVYAGSDPFSTPGYVVAINAETGEEQWNLSRSAMEGEGITVANGSVYFIESGSGPLTRVSENGSVVWEYQDVTASSPEYHNGTVYVPNSNNQVVGVDERTGNKTTTISTDGVIDTVVIEDRVLYAWSSGGEFVSAHDLGSGNQLWKQPATSRPIIETSEGPNGSVFVERTATSDSDPAMSAYDAGTGAEIWRTNASEFPDFGPNQGITYSDGVVIGIRGTGVSAVNGSNGSIVWTADHGNYGAGQATAGGGVAYFGDNVDGGVWGVNVSDGSLYWESAGGETDGLPTFSSGGVESDGTRIEDATYGMLGPAEPCEGLWVDTREYMEHNLTTDVTVYAYDDEDGWTDVTNDSNVTVDKTNALTYSDGELTSTTDKSVNEIVELRAEYDRFYGTADVVVATETVNNTNILPPMQSATATLGDDNGLVVVMATAISAGIAFFASSLAGVAAFPVIITGAWVAGYVGTHILLGGLLMSIFIGLNVAQVVEYSGS